MSINVEVAEQLAAKGLLSQDNVQAAAELLNAPLNKMAEAEKAEFAALQDERELAKTVRHAKAKMQVDEDAGDLVDEAQQEHVIHDAVEQRLDDEDAIESAEQAINDAYDEAGAALMDAGLIDAGQLVAVSAAISQVWLKHKAP